MMRRSNKEPIDAGAVLDEREEARAIQDARGASTVQGAKAHVAGAKPMLIVSVVAALGVGGMFVAQAMNRPEPGEERAAAEAVVKNPRAGVKLVDEGTGDVPPPPPFDPMEAEGGVGVEAIPVDGPAPGVPTGRGQVPALTAAPPQGGGYNSYPPPPTAVPKEKPLTPAQLVHLRRLNGALGGEERERGVVQPVSAGVQPGRAGEADTGGVLQDALKPMRLSAQTAAKLQGRDFMLTQGAMLDCVLLTRIVSDVPGMTACHLTRDVYSTNGRVVLLDKGSRVVGSYEGGMRQGQRRIFIKWSRVETPQGVIINIDSPGTGPLGEGGVSGWVDTHFRERFGGAILLSLVDDLGDWFANRNRSSGQIQFGNSSDAAQEMARTTLENSINIPPTLYKNQGERLSIFVARDLDFRGVYSLAARR